MYTISYEFPCQPNLVESGGCLMGLVKVSASWLRHSQISKKKRDLVCLITCGHYIKDFYCISVLPLFKSCIFKPLESHFKQCFIIEVVIKMLVNS